MGKITLNSITEEITGIRKAHPVLKDDAAFVFWFINAYLVQSEKEARESLTGKEGGSFGEKNIDAVYIDERQRQCNIIQGKYRASLDVAEKRNDILQFMDVALLPWQKKAVQDSFFAQMDPLVLEKIKEVITLVKNKKYQLNLYYVTTGKCTDTIVNEAKAKLREAEEPVGLQVITGKEVLTIFEKVYLEGIAPARLPEFKIRIVSDGAIRHTGEIYRFERETGIESWVFTASGSDIGDMYARAGDRLFAKNIRGYLGEKTDINDSIRQTIQKEPRNFWYYNNGVTIVCDNARKETRDGEECVIIEGAQVINGQQTTRTLHTNHAEDVSVLVKVIKIPKEGDYDEYDKLVNSIVRATNWQNAISPVDLVSNDYIQVYLEQELRKVGYQYIRKNMSKTEARRQFGQGYFQIDKVEMAQAVASCLFDPAIVRKGKRGLFEDPYYKMIFNRKQLSFYLSKYWLMREVQYAASGYPERSYAKWVVMHFLWEMMGKQLDQNGFEKKFRYCSERKLDDIKIPLNNAAISAFRAALAFYRKNRGEGESAKDVSSFFQQTNLHKQFRNYWDSQDNKQRIGFDKSLSTFTRRINDLIID